jgi:ribonuclease-3
MANSNDLEQLLGVKFKDPKLLETALTHRSYVNENRSSDQTHNERLEFLGDAVLELVVTEYLYLTYGEPEGVLTNWRSALVKTGALSEVAVKLGLNDYIKLSRGEKRGSDRARRQILANTTEAVIGALYLDQNYDVVKEFITKHVISLLPAILKSGSWQDAKSKLQEVAQEKHGFTPVYKVLSEEGPDHDKVFTVGVYVGQEKQGEGTGSSKQVAQQAAAEAALTNYR